MIYINDKTECLTFPQNGVVAVSGPVKYVLYKTGRPVEKTMSGYMTPDETNPNLITWRPDEETMAEMKSLDQSCDYCLCLFDAEEGLPVSMTFVRIITRGGVETPDIVEREV